MIVFNLWLVQTTIAVVAKEAFRAALHTAELRLAPNIFDSRDRQRSIGPELVCKRGDGLWLRVKS